MQMRKPTESEDWGLAIAPTSDRVHVALIDTDTGEIQMVRCNQELPEASSWSIVTGDVLADRQAEDDRLKPCGNCHRFTAIPGVEEGMFSLEVDLDAYQFTEYRPPAATAGTTAGTYPDRVKLHASSSD